VQLTPTDTARPAVIDIEVEVEYPEGPDDLPGERIPARRRRARAASDHWTVT
jgi:hypothetical protein